MSDIYFLDIPGDIVNTQTGAVVTYKQLAADTVKRGVPVARTKCSLQDGLYAFAIGKQPNVITDRHILVYEGRVYRFVYDGVELTSKHTNTEAV